MLHIVVGLYSADSKSDLPFSIRDLAVSMCDLAVSMRDLAVSMRDPAVPIHTPRSSSLLLFNFCFHLTHK